MAVTIGIGSLRLGGAILTTSAGDKIAVYMASGGGTIYVDKDVDGTPTNVDSETATIAFGGSTCGWVHAAIDGNDDIHIIASCTTEQTRDVAYVICDLTTGFGAWEEAYNYTETAPTTPGCSISLDSSDKPHILVVDAVKVTGSTGDNVYYTEKTGASWATPTKIGLRAVKTDFYNSPKITLRNNDDIEAFYYFSTAGDPAYNTYTSGAWQGENVYTETIATVESVTATTGGTVYRYHRWAATNPDSIDENNTDTTYNTNSTITLIKLSAALSPDDGTSRYVFYLDISNDVHLISNDGGGWTDEGVLQTGATYDRVIAEWAYNNENQSGEITYIFSDATTIYYDSFSLGTTVNDSQGTYLKGIDTTSDFQAAFLAGSLDATPDNQSSYLAGSAAASDNQVVYLEGGAAPAIAFTNLGVNANPDIETGDNLDTYSTTSWTPPTSGVILIAARWRQSPEDHEHPLISGNNLVWHMIAEESAESGTTATALYAAFASGSSTGVTSFDFLGRTGTHFQASFSQVTGAYEGGSIQDVFAQIVLAIGTGTSGTITMPTASSSDNRPWAMFAHVTPEAHSPRTNWTELDDLGAGDSLQTQYRGDSMETTASASWSTNENWVGIALEIRASSATGLAGHTMPYWRVRDDDSVALNSTTFSAAENTPLTILQGQKFRVRVKVSRSNTGATLVYKMQSRYVPADGIDGSAWTNLGTLAAGISDGPIVPLLSDQYTDGAATTELLTTDETWQAGEGIETAPQTGNAVPATIDLDAKSTEFEWLLQIISSLGDPYHRYMVPGGKVYLRVVIDDGSYYGQAFENPYNEVELTIGQNNGYIGATFAEKSSRVMHYDTNGNLYYLAETSEHNAETTMYKSTDRGDTWLPIDYQGRPLEWDLEATDMHVVGSTGYIFSQLNDEPYFDRFYFSDHGSTPDTWAIQQNVKDPVVRDDQVCAGAWRSDGTAIIFFEELVSTYRRITYRIRTSGGVWGSDNNLDSQATTDFVDVWAVLGDSDLLHIFYTDRTNGKLYHNTITSGDSLGTREEVGTNAIDAGSPENPIAGVVRYDSSGTDRIVCAFRDAAGRIAVTKVDDNGSPASPTTVSDADVATSPAGAGSHMPLAGIVVEGTNLWIIYADVTTSDLWITKSADYGAWDTDVEILDGVDIATFFTMIYFAPSAGGKYIGYILEDSSYGGNGLGWYREYEVEASGTDTSDNQSAYLKGSIDATPDNQSAYLAGQDDATPDNQLAYLKGSEDTTPDNQIAYLKGQDDATPDAQYAYLAGSEDALDNQYAYLKGIDSTSDSQYAYLKGHDTASDNQGAYLAGSTDVTDVQSAYLAGGIVSTDNTGAFTQGQDTASDTQTAFLSGGIVVSDTQSSYLKGQDSDSDSSTAYLLGGIVSTDNQAAYAAGQDTALDNQTAYLKGSSDDLDNQSAYTSGTDTAVDNQAAFLKGGIDVVDNQIAYLLGSDIALDNQAAFLEGTSTVQDNQLAFLQGSSDATDNQYAHTWGQDTSSDNQLTYTRGALDSSDNQSAYLAGTDTAEDTQSAFLVGGIVVTDTQYAYLKGQSTASDTQSAYLVGSDDALDNQLAYTAGTSTAEDNQVAYLKGSSSTSDNQTAYLAGGINVVDNQAAYLEGISPTSDNQSAYLSGTSDSLDNQVAFLAGTDTASDTQSAYMAGGIVSTDTQYAYTAGEDSTTGSTTAYLRGSTDTQDNFSAFLNGSSDTSSNQIAFLAGGIEVSDSQLAYLQGSPSAVSDNQAAYLAGIDTTSDNQIAYLVGTNTAEDTQAAFLSGSLTASSNQATYLLGSQDSTANVSAYLAGTATDLDSQSAFTQGQDTASDTQTAYLSGGINVTDNQAAYLDANVLASDNQAAYLEGFGEVYGTQSAYLAGISTTLDNQSTYLAGSQDSTDTQLAYLSGQSSALDNQPAYVLGGINIASNTDAYLEGATITTSSTSAYLYGMGERLGPDGDISQSGSWEREDSSPSNLYQSIDEWPGINDTDYVWHDNGQVGNYFEVSLSDPAFDTVGPGEVKIFWRIKRRAGSETLTLKIEIREDTTVIASDSKVLTDTDTTQSFTLSSVERDSISDWNDLRIRFTVESVT